MNIILMQCEGGRDCHNAAIGTACQVSYDDASKATGHKDLAATLESPIFSNPWNMYRALAKLGFWKKNITLTNLLQDAAEPMRTIVLIHNLDNPTLSQHWIVWGGIKGGYHVCYWGDSDKPRLIAAQRLESLFRRGWPNCAFQVYKANFFRLMWEKLKMLFS